MAATTVSGMDEQQAAPYDRKAEVEGHLEADETRIGETYRWSKEGLTLQQQAERAGVTYGNYGYNNTVIIRALAEGVIPKGPTLALAAARKTRAWLKEKPLSEELKRDLKVTEAALMLQAGDRSAQESEDQVATEVTKKVLAQLVPGIYVYTLPHYWRHKVDPDLDQTYLKVGKSDTDVFSRIGQQRTTALPEDPWLLRIYPTRDAAAIERRFHAMLEAADHRRTESKKGGREWFLTSLRFLDWYAAELGLEIQRPNEDTVGED